MKKTSGFTLIEVMIVVAIIGILASIAIPNYQDSISKSRRADAKGALLGFSNALERHYTETTSYTSAAGTVGTPTDTGLPFIYATQSPVDGGTALYTLRINAANDTTYTVYAVPTGPQTGDKCGTLTLDQAGTKNITSATAGIVSGDCW